MNRADATLYLQKQLGAVLTEIGAGLVYLDHAIDEALLLMGTAPSALTSATVPDADTLKFRAVLRYVVLKWAADATAIYADVSGGQLSVSKKKQQIFQGVRAQLADAERAVRFYGIDLATVGVMRSGVYNLDALEPEVVA